MAGSADHRIRYCQCCGQLIPPVLAFPGAPVRQRVYEFVARHPEGATIRQIISYAYADDIDGGPECADKSIHTLIHYMNKQLRDKGLIVKATSGPGATYALRQL